MNNDLEEIAALALRNAFWLDFSALVNEYLAAAAGMDVDAQKRMMGDLTSIYGTKVLTTIHSTLGIYSHDGAHYTRWHRTILNALNDLKATCIYIRGQRVFEKHNDEWHYLEPK